MNEGLFKKDAVSDDGTKAHFPRIWGKVCVCYFFTFFFCEEKTITEIKLAK